MAEIFAFREDKLGFRYQLGPRTVLGRAPECDLIIFDRGASPRHAEIFQDNGRYFIAGLGGANGTLLNDRPVAGRVPLEPFDTIKLGQELFVFEPGLSVVTGPAPSAIIIEKLHEPAAGLVSAPAGQAAAQVAPEDVPALMTLSHRLLQRADPGEIGTVVLKHLQDRFGLTFMALLWPGRPPARRLVSLLTSHGDKRLLLGRTPFDRAVKNREVLLWPSSISDLTFQNRNRRVGQVNRPVLLGPVQADRETAGLLYLENQDREFTPGDLPAFAAALAIISPALADLAGARVSPAPPEARGAPRKILASHGDTFKIVLSTAIQAAAGSSPIMLHGEAGTGKGDLAAYIHDVSHRKGGRLVTVNLAALPPSEIEAALFGLAQAPNSSERRTGLVEQADGGTLFLRHVEHLPPLTQKFLLMAMVEGLFFPVGSSRRGQAVDFRIISSTSIDLASLVEAGQFREDLFLRLNGLTIYLPPLREIKDDLGTFLNIFLNRAARSLGVNFDGVDPGALECLRAYSWPGNLTELNMEAWLMLLFNRNGRVTLDDLPLHLRLAPESFMGREITVPPLVGEAERHQLQAAMSRCQGDLELVAELLAQRPEYVIQKMRALKVDPINYQNPGVFQHLPKGPGQTVMPAD